MRLIFLLWLITFTAQAQPLRYFTHFTEKDGLSDNNVQCILRDQQGYLWVGTSNGLNRYDGYTFRQYHPDARQSQRTVSNENIYDIKQDSDGYIWLATANGLNRYDPRTETFKVWKNTGRNDGSLPNSLVWNIFIGPKNQLWLSSDNRDLCRFDPKTGQFKTFPWKAFLDKKRPDAVSAGYKTIYYCRKRGGNGLWFLTNFGLFSFDMATETFDFHPFPKHFTAKKKSSCPDAVFIGSWDNDLLHYEACTRQWSQVKLPISPKLLGGRRYVTDVFPIGKNYWVLGREGLFLMDTASFQMQSIQPTLENESTAPTGLMNNHFLEKNGMLWLGGKGGLWLFDSAAQHFNYTPLKPENTNDFYNTYCRFMDSKLDGRRYQLNYYGQQIQVFKNSKSLKNIQLPGFAAALFEDKQGQIWVSGGAQIFQLDRKNLILKPFPIPAHLLENPSNSIFYDIEQDAAGNYWFANNREGVLVWKPEKNEWWKPGENEEFIGKAVSDLLADHERRTMWIATQDYGLFRFDEKTSKFTLYRQEENDPEHSLGAYIVNGLCKDGQGHIWAATDPGGISRFDYDAPPGQQFTTLNSEDGLPSNQVFSVLTDAAGHVWAGTSKGLAWVESRRLRVRSFGKNDGMVNDYLDLPLSLAANGEVLSGTVYGYQSFHPDSILKEKTTPGILLTAFRIFDKNYTDSLNINYLQDINLTWQQNFFSFEFASTDFLQPKKHEYAYRLTSFNKDWIYLKNRHTASYTGVPPGDYVLEIKSGKEGRWHEPGVRLGIHIAPPFWATWWFRSLTILLFAGAIWGLYRRRISQIKKEEALKTEFNQRIARTEMAALRAQMNPHFVFNCLSSINRFILVNRPDEASAYLTKFSRLIRLILDNSRTETVPLNKELDALQLYVEMEQMRFNDRFEYRLEVTDDVQPEHLEVPPLLIQPFVENAIWHGLMHKKAQGILRVRVFYEGKKLCIEVEDNGVGRQRAMELKSRSATVDKSLGMKVTAERLEVINQLYGTNATVETMDLKDRDGKAAGTKVKISF
ncbi:MAG: histidine kinase [Saprospiraceae bacterium]|nr:histidine kinase [Saprospiraceae bacterium]MCF8252626.1 histidine kinase [Saprospiraceae bacterium]MCF8283115.1 histidine kinase [Bacteroidales bacterium]MCF8314203.1 histidine kinase [Saprospiraceae bacterium]MCF8443003.1 histidine kinase [Saprospiraceae bacterium]